MLGLGLSLQKGVSAFNAGRALVSSYIRRVTDAGGVLQNTACDVAAINELNQDRLLEPASWVLVPDGIKEDVVYAQKPSTGLGDLTFTRASDATYTDSTGVVRRSPYNLLTQSVWTGGGVNVAPTGWAQSQITGNFEPQTSINGSVPYRFYGTSARRFFLQSVSLNAGQDARVSLFVNSVAVATDIGNILVVIGASNVKYYVNNVEVVSSTLLTANSRIELSFTAPTTGTYPIRIGGGSSNASTYDYVISQPQIVEGTSTLDYFPTTNRQDVPRIDFRNADGTLSSCGRLLLEPQRTNSIRNSSMVGAVAGTPGTLPTNWTEVLSGLTRSVVGVGVENGLPYVDLRLNGTANSTSVILGLEGSISASLGQSWSESVYCKIIASPSNANSFSLLVFERNSSFAYITEGSTIIVPTSDLQRFAFTRTTTSATIAYVQPYIRFNLTNGATYDFTIRIAAPQLELGAYATTWVPTTTAAVTRIADFASKTGVSSLIGQTEGTLFVEVDTAVLGNVFSGTGRRFLTISDNTINNRIIIFQNATNDFIQVVVVNGGVEQANISTSTNQSGIKKIAASYANNDFVLYINGVQIGTDSSGTVPACSRLAIGYETTSNLSNPACPVAQAALFPTRLTNDQLEVLTSEGYGNYALLAQSLNYVLQ